MRRHRNVGQLSFIFVLVAAVLCCQCLADEWRNWTAPGWSSISQVALGPDGAFWMHGGTGEMGGLLKGTVRGGLVGFRQLSPYNSLCVPGLIYDIHCDLNGLWLATDQGLVLYEGIYSVFYTPDNSPLPVKKVVHLCAGPEGSLWVATDQSVHLLKGGLWTDFTTASTIIPDVVDSWMDCMAFDEKRGILAYKSTVLSGHMPTVDKQYDSLCVLDLATVHWTRISLSDIDFMNGGVADMVFDADGLLWFAVGNGVASFDGADWTYYSGNNSGLPLPYAGFLNKLALDHEGELYALAEGDSGGVCKFVAGEWVMLPVHAPYCDTYFYDMLFDFEGALWVFTNHGYIRFDSGGSTLYSLPTNSLCDADAYERIVPSRTSDAVWLMADGAGICRLKDGAWESWTPDTSGLASYTLSDMAEGPDGALWVLSLCSKYDHSQPDQMTLQRFDGTSWTSFSNGVSHFAPRITNYAHGRVLVDPSNNVWVGVSGFVLKFDGEYWRKILLPEGDESSDVLSMALDEQTGKLAFGLAPASLCVLGENGWTGAVPLDPHYHVVSLAYDHDGVLWGVTTTAQPAPVTQNAFSYDGTNVAIYNSQLTGVPMEYTYCVAVDANNVKWFGRYVRGMKHGGGAVTFDGLTWREHTSENFGFMQTFGGQNPAVCSIAFAPNGDAWFGSAYYGVSRLSNRGQPDPFPTIQVVLDKPEYAPGDVMSASLVESNLGSTRWEVNVIIAVMAPDGSLFFFPNWTALINIFMSQLLLPGTLTQPMEFFQLPISESLPKGQYTWFAALGQEAGLISGISSASFMIN